MSDLSLQHESEFFLTHILMGSSLHPWILGQSVPNVITRIVIGIAPWSSLDVRLLDNLNDSISRNKDASFIDWIDVFNVANCKSMSDFELAIPNIGKVYQTPVVGHWKNGLLIASASGFSGRTQIEHYMLTLDRMGLNPLPETIS